MNAAVSSSTPAIDPARAKQKRRAWWLRQLHAWHWITAAVSLIGMVLFSVTGITLNHAADIPGAPVVTRSEAVLPAPLLAELQAVAKRAADDGTAADLPDAVSRWLAETLDVRASGAAVEWSEDEAYLSLPRPGGDAWINVELATGRVERETTDRGVISYLNDLHKGRHTGFAWSLLLDVFAIACLLFSLTGLWLLHLHSRGRRLTWPLVGFGLLVPVLVAVIFIH